MLLQGVLALEPLAAALRLADEPGVSFAGFLVLFKAKNVKEQVGRDKVYLFCFVFLISKCCMLPPPDPVGKSSPPTWTPS